MGTRSRWRRTLPILDQRKSSQLENQILTEEPGSHSSHVDLQQITPDTLAQAEKPASKKKEKEKV